MTALLFQVYLRGSMIRFIILPDMLKKAPMFKRVQQVSRRKPFVPIPKWFVLFCPSWNRARKKLSVDVAAAEEEDKTRNVAHMFS